MPSLGLSFPFCTSEGLDLMAQREFASSDRLVIYPPSSGGQNNRQQASEDILTEDPSVPPHFQDDLPQLSSGDSHGAVHQTR